MKKFSKLIFVLIFPISSVFSAFAEPKFSANFNVIGLTLNGEDIAKSGYSWADNKILKQIPIIPIVAPSLSLSYGFPAPHKSKEKPKKMSLISTEAFLRSDITPLSASVGAEVSLYITPLLQLSAKTGILSGWNFSSSNPSLGIYNYKEGEYDKITSFSECVYDFSGKASIVIPLPKGFMIQPSYEHKYVGFTGADDKEPWKCGISNAVNGWQYNASVMIAKMLPYERLKMFALIGSVSGYYYDFYFDDRYKNYNPDFVNASIIPMASFRISEKQSLMVQGIISRVREFEEDDLDTDEELIATYKKSVWKFKTIMVIWSIKL